jgi:glycosyltransferase involved in cell wall biosynthesis
LSEKLIKICLVSPLPPPLGGIGRWTTLVCRWTANLQQIRITQVDISPRWRAIDDMSIWKRVLGGGLQLIRDYIRFLIAVPGVDVIHLTTSGRLAVVRDLGICTTAKLLRIPIVYHLHFGRVPDIARANTLEWRMLLCAMKLAFIVLPLDRATASTIHSLLPQKRVEIIPNPIDPAMLPTPTHRPSRKKTLLFLGWILPSKGVEELFGAWNQLANDDWELVIAGPGTTAYQDHLVSLFKPRGIRFVGEVPHKAALQLLADCDIFVLPSHTEAFPFVVLEAMALGKAIVATDVGAIPEMLDGECGILVKPQDVQSLAQGLRELMTNEGLRVTLGGRAGERALENYTADTVFSQLLMIWQTAVKKII